MSIEHTTRAITENKYAMQLFADKKTLEADISMLKQLKTSNPSDERASDYIIKQKEYELSQIENRIKGKDYTSVKTQCEQYFADNSTLFDKNTIINETRSMLSRGQTVNEWPHLAAVFLIDHANVTDTARQNLAAVKPQPGEQDPAPAASLSQGEEKIESTPVKQGKPQSPRNTPKNKPNSSNGTNTLLYTPPVQPKNTPEILTTQQKVIFKDGAYYLTGPKGNTRRVEVSELLVNLNLPKNAPENLKKSVQIIGDFSLLLDAYIAANPKEQQKHTQAVEQVQALFAQQDIQMGKKILDVTNITRNLFSNFRITLGDTDLRKVNEAFRIQDDSARRFAILNFIRDDLGQSDLVLAKIMEKNTSYFAFPSDENILANGDLSAAGLGASGRLAVEKTIRKAHTEASSNWEKHYQEYLAQFKADNPGVQVNEDLARKNNEKLTVLALAKREIMYQKLYNKDVSGELALAQSIMGATTLGMSDKAWDVSKEIGGMIAMEAIAIAAGVVTAGVATAAINAAMLGRNAYRGAKALEAYNAASKTRKALTTSARILGSGVGFEFGAASTRGIIENGDWKSMHSLEGYTQSIAMMGVMGGIGKLISAGKLGKGIQFKEGAGFAKNILPFTGQIAIEGTAIFGASATIGSVFFDRRDNWTLEQIAQAMLMAALFKGAGRISASKNPKGEIEVKQTTTERPVEVKVERQAGYTERYIVDGKEYRWNPKQDAFIGKNGERYTKEQFEKLQAEKALKIEHSEQKTKSKVSAETKSAEKTDNTETPKPTEPEALVQKTTEKPVETKIPEAVVKNTEAVIAEAASPGMARKAMDSVVNSARTIGESFSPEWIAKMSHKIGKPVKWLADQSVGPVFRMVTGNNPSALLSLINPAGGWTSKASGYGKNFVEHWKHPIHNLAGLSITGERVPKSPFIGMIAKNIIFAGGITALDYFAVPNEDANTPANMLQNYYEMLLFGWLGILLMEREPVIEGVTDMKDWISDRIQAKPL